MPPKSKAAGNNFAFHTESLLFGLLRQRTSIGTPRRVSEGCSDDLPSMEPGEFSSCCAFSIAGENTFVKLLNLVYNTVKICTFGRAAVEASAWRSSLGSDREGRIPQREPVLWKTFRRPGWARWGRGGPRQKRRGDQDELFQHGLLCHGGPGAELLPGGGAAAHHPADPQRPHRQAPWS